MYLITEAITTSITAIKITATIITLVQLIKVTVYKKHQVPNLPEIV